MNIYNQNVAFNYRGILNLDATTINTPLDATLRAVTDGMGTSSPLQLSTDQVGLSRTVALSAGATNPRLFNEVYTINNSGAQTGTLTGIFLNATETALNGMTHNLMDLQVGGSSKFKVDRVGNIFAAAGTQLTIGQIYFGNAYILNPSNGNLTFYNNAASGFNLLQLGGTTSSFPAIKRNGAAIDFRLADDSAYADINVNKINVIAATQSININGATVIDYGSGLRINNQYGTQNVGIYYNSGTLGLQLNGSTGLLQLQGTTSSFPAIKRNGAAIDFRLADDSAACAITTGNITANGSIGLFTFASYYQFNAGGGYLSGTYLSGAAFSTNGPITANVTGSVNASAMLQADSTTKGFLPPRMTTTQKNAIATPAAGLVVYDTTLAKLCVYTTAWETITSI